MNKVLIQLKNKLRTENPVELNKHNRSHEFTAKVIDSGRITIPSSLRKLLKLKTGTRVTLLIRSTKENAAPVHLPSEMEKMA
jgi:bifunctional DNA-binding transcriptional regulator/antitoxin component of YhaV-PrlF toxin-antitoxin module